MNTTVLLVNHRLAENGVRDVDIELILKVVILGVVFMIDGDGVESLDDLVQLARDEVVIGIQDVLDNGISLITVEITLDHVPRSLFKLGGGERSCGHSCSCGSQRGHRFEVVSKKSVWLSVSRADMSSQ